MLWVLMIAGCLGSAEDTAEERAAAPARREVAPAEAVAQAELEFEHAVAPVAEVVETPVSTRVLIAGEMVDVPAGTQIVGSWPGTVGRDPGSEADRIAVEVPAFSIDRLPYPNDPALPPRTGASRAEAESTCAAQGKRLCGELEWERACAGDQGRAFPSGETMDLERCALEPLACVSMFDAASMGTTLSEWTASPASRGLGNEILTAVVRGAGPNAPVEEHRCASRHAVSPDRRSSSLGFRCCRGGETAPPLVYPEERARGMYRVLRIDTAEIRRILSSVPEVARWADDFDVFSEVQIQQPLARAGRTPEDMPGWIFTTGPLRWAPTAGEEAFVVAGSGARSSILVVLYPMPDGTHRHAASFILENEPVPIAIGYSNGSRRELLWSACWGCGGEGGAITFRDDGRIVIVQR